jgi:hypothetical protein
MMGAMKSDKRKHKRFPVLRDMAEPVELYLMDDPARDVPAVLTNLSQGGMSMVIFAPVHGDAKLKIVLNLPGLEGAELEGHVTWTEAKGDTTAVGVRFDHLSRESTQRINRMAEDFQDCELKLSFGVRDVCFKECGYWPLCSKPVKLKS